MIVEFPSAYNVVLGRLALNWTRSVVSTYSLVVKFPTPHRVGSMQGDQATAWYCYVNSLWRNALTKSLSMEKLDPRDGTDQATPIEYLVPLALDDKLPD